MGLLDKQKKKLKTLQADVIANHPLFKERFADAKMIEGMEKVGNCLLAALERVRKSASQSIRPRSIIDWGCCKFS